MAQAAAAGVRNSTEVAKAAPALPLPNVPQVLVPGRGECALLADYPAQPAPPPLRTTATTTTPTTPANGSTGAPPPGGAAPAATWPGGPPGSNSSNGNAAPASFAGPLGLVNATSISVLRSSLGKRSSEDQAAIVSDAKATSRANSLVSRQSSGPRELGMNSPLLKKLAGFGSTLSSKLNSPSNGASDSAAPPNGLRHAPRSSTAREDDLAVPSTPPIAAFVRGDALCFVVLQDGLRRSKDVGLSFKLRAPPTAHVIAPRAESDHGIQALIGFASGEVFLYSDIHFGASHRKIFVGPPALFNKDGILAKQPVVAVQWLPNSTTRFIVVHYDGTVLQYDVLVKSHAMRGRAEAAEDLHDGNDQVASANATSEQSLHGKLLNGSMKRTTGMAPRPSNQTTDVHVWRKNKRVNPTAGFTMAAGGIVVAKFAPSTSRSSHCLALACRDGFLRILDWSRERLIVAFRSYYGAFLSLAWSPDGEYIATGGEDDLVSVWDPIGEVLLARLEGHSSWVCGISWDVTPSLGPYRLCSAGQDTRIAFWEIDINEMTGVSIRSSKPRRKSGTPGSSAANHSSRSKASDVEGNAVEDHHAEKATVVPAARRGQVPTLRPLEILSVHTEPLTDINLLPDFLLTACAGGGFRCWRLADRSIASPPGAPKPVVVNK